MTEITEQITEENDELAQVYVDQTVIINYERLNDIYGRTFKIPESMPHELFRTYQKPLIYYQHTEDNDFMSNIKKLRNVLYPNDDPIIFDEYTEDTAELQYLESSPVSFLILGKPEIGQTDLARLISEHWKCVYISPESVLREEITSETRAGKCINYNLTNGRSVGPEILLRLVEKRIKSQSCQHRGYVISGFPLLKNSLFLEDPISTESAVFYAQEIFEEVMPDIPDKPGSVSLILGDPSEVGTEDEHKVEDEEEEGTKKKKPVVEKKSDIHLSRDIDLGPSETTIVTLTEPFNMLKQPKEQIDFLKNALGHPLIIIYVMCSALDVHSKRKKLRYNIYFGREVISNEKEEDDSTTIEQNVDDPPDSAYQIDGIEKKTLVKLPIHLKECISSQLWQYKCHVHGFINQLMLQQDPQKFIKVDGRLTADNMYECIHDRLRMLGFQRALLPEKFTEEDLGDIPEEIQAPEKESPIVAFQSLREKMIIGPMYKYQLSNWAFKCPVALKEGRSIEGRTEYALRFMNKIYFLSSEENLLKFYRNPRPYLLPVNPTIPCRIWILGPKCSGKSAVAKCLSFLYNAKVFDPDMLENTYKKKKENEFLDIVRSRAIPEALVQINDIRAKERKENIDNWKMNALDVLHKAYEIKLKPLSSSLNKINQEHELNVRLELVEIDEKLKELQLPLSLNTIEEIITENTLCDYIPDEFKVPIESATVFDSYVTNYVDTAIKNTTIPDMSLSLQEKIEMFKTEIELAEQEYNNLYHLNGGWIIDGMPLDPEMLNLLSPSYLADDIICLVDSDPTHSFLISKFMNKDFSHFNKYNEVYANLRLEPLNTIYPIISASSKLHFVESLVSDVQDSVEVLIDSQTNIDALASEKYIAHEESINQFYFEWTSFSDFLMEHNIVPIEINVENKSTVKLLSDVVVELENKYRKVGTIMTVEEKLQEHVEFSDPNVGGEGGYGEGESGDPNFFANNRRLGYTNMYCPMTYYYYNVLWKGKENYAVKFEQQVYLLCNEESMNEFVINPRLYLKKEPSNKILPTRICIIGVPGSGKTSIAKKLAENYGLHYINYDEYILDALCLPNKYDFHQINELDPYLDNILFNHESDLEKIRQYYENDYPLGDEITKNVLHRLWYEMPYRKIGFVLDNFPRRPSDVPIMVENRFIPDIVIELLVTPTNASTRMEPIRFRLFRDEIAEKTRRKELQNELIHDEWAENRLNKLKELLEEKREQRKLDAENKKLNPTPNESGLLQNIAEQKEDIEYEDDVSFVYDEVMEMEDLEEINKILNIEMPEPMFQDLWPTEDDTTQRVLTDLDKEYHKELEFIDVLRNLLLEENIDCTAIDTDIHTVDKVLYETIRVTDKFKFSNFSIFERVYEINLNTAEQLLERGFYFISKFGRTCPVQIYENINPIQMFLPGESNSTCYPLIYKRYIYFINGIESRDKFKSDPLKYVLNKDCKFPLIPFRIAIIGPPKSGKTTIAQRFKRELKMKVITNGSALRSVIEELPECELSKNIMFLLSRGYSATVEMTAKAVETATLKCDSLSQGIIMDGFPNTQQEMDHLKYLGIYPHMILDLQTTGLKMKEYASYIHRPPFPTYSPTYINHLYEQWKRHAYNFRYYIEREFQNIYNVENNSSKWQLWDQARETAFKILKSYQYYLKMKEYDTVLHVEYLSLTPSDFFEHYGVFTSYCALCYYYNEELIDCGPYPNRNYIYQYIGEYYFICDQHIDLFKENPRRYLPPRNEKLLPDDLPKIVKDAKNLNAIYEEGLCIVSFWENQPFYSLVKGDTNFVVSYKGRHYLFCSEICMTKFLRTPTEYYDRIINFKIANPIEFGELRKLPTLGYLEQLAARLLIEAIIDVEIQRPYFVGMSISTSAAVHIALYLKRKNPKIPKLFVQLYDEAQERLEERRRKLKLYLAYFKGRLNPYVTYEPRHPYNKKEDDMKALQSDIQKWMNASDHNVEYIGQ